MSLSRAPPSTAVLRPRDWVGRFAGNLASYGADRPLRFSNDLEPVTVSAIQCLRMDIALRDSHSHCFNHVLDFA